MNLLRTIDLRQRVGHALTMFGQRLRESVGPQGLVVAALIGSMCDPSTYWPDIDLARVRVETTAAFC